MSTNTIAKDGRLATATTAKPAKFTGADAGRIFLEIKGWSSKC